MPPVTIVYIITSHLRINTSVYRFQIRRTFYIIEYFGIKYRIPYYLLHTIAHYYMSSDPSSTPPPAAEVKKSLSQEFFDFLKVFGIIGLAIAFVIGQAASRLVTALVNDIVDPLIGLFLPAGSLEQMSVKIPNISGSTSQFKYGDLISNIIDFLIIAFIVFLAYKQLSRYKIVEDKTKPESK
jgi:large conductance mechanosensitive channel